MPNPPLSRGHCRVDQNIPHLPPPGKQNKQKQKPVDLGDTYRAYNFLTLFKPSNKELLHFDSVAVHDLN